MSEFRERVFTPGRANGEQRERISHALSSSEELVSLRPALLGEGKMRAVFEIPRSAHDRFEKKEQRGLVVKVDKGATEAALYDLFRTGNLEISTAQRESFSRRFVHERFSYRVYQESFSPHVLPEKAYMRKVPLTRALVREFYPHMHVPASFPAAFEVTTFVYVQARAPQEAFSEASLGMLFGCSESERISSDSALFHANRTFIDLHESWHDIRQLSGLSPDVRALMHRVREDVSLRSILRQFLAQAFSYTERTGEIVDLFGADNARLFHDAQGDWKLVLLDAYAKGRAFAHAQEAIRAAILGFDITNNEGFALIASLNYARHMNALALAINAPERFRLSRADIAPVVQKLTPFLRKVLKVG